MSRLDTTDFDLSVAPRSSTIGRDGANGYVSSIGMTSYAQRPDRRPSLALSTYPQTTSRSFASQKREYAFGTGDPLGTNRHNSNNSSFAVSSPISHRPSPPLPQTSPNSIYSSSTPSERDSNTAVRNILRPTSPTISSSRSTLWWGDLEPWMDEEYAKQVCTLMGWDPTNARVPRPQPDPITGQQANNPGYCFLTFPTPAHAASVLAQINNAGNGSPAIMPNSSRPFVMNWASNVPSASPISYPVMPTALPNTQQAQQYQKEYSIFVGDLAPEASNSDLVAVFRNPVLGLRNDREPKFIRPFLSCKSAKIMLDPVTGVSRGYGFVRFTDEADQQRALIEMHGLYCLSRPMRISPATAKYKPPPSLPATDLPQVQYPLNPVTLALPLHNSGQAKNVTTPITYATSNSSLTSAAVSSSGSGSTLGGSNSGSSLSSGTASTGSLPTPFNSLTSEEMMNLPNNVLAQIAQQYANSDSQGASVTSLYAQDNMSKQSEETGLNRYSITEESWKHHAQARAILGNLIGPNGEQLTSTDPYNTTVFVGGLSPLISEETLRTFFVPFGDIHYVKVPAGKHCGFVQFVRKADAERAIEKMQGFPIGGSRIRLSWGRSQYKAAQAAAQAAQTAALQASTTHLQGAMTQEQAMQILQKFTLQGYLDNSLPINAQFNGSGTNSNALLREAYTSSALGNMYDDLHSRATALGTQPLDSYLTNSILTHPNDPSRVHSNFSPFSPDPNIYETDARRKDASSFILSHASKSYAPGFLSLSTSDVKSNGNYVGDDATKNSPREPRSSSATRYGDFGSGVAYSSTRPDVTISKQSSGSTSTERENRNADPLQDLNGTLANLDLDRQKSWNSQTNMFERNPQLQQFPRDDKSTA